MARIRHCKNANIDMMNRNTVNAGTFKTGSNVGGGGIVMDHDESNMVGTFVAAISNEVAVVVVVAYSRNVWTDFRSWSMLILWRPL